jgi:hypothetical protein
MLEALNEIAGPDGVREAARFMVPANPFKLVSVTVEDSEEPAVITKLLGFAEMAKSSFGEGLTTTVIETARDNDPLVPAIVTT